MSDFVDGMPAACAECDDTGFVEYDDLCNEARCACKQCICRHGVRLSCPVHGERVKKLLTAAEERHRARSTPQRTLAEVEAAEADLTFDLLVAKEQFSHAHDALRALLTAYDHVFRAELSTTEQQIALGRARRIVEGA